MFGAKMVNEHNTMTINNLIRKYGELSGNK